MSVLECFVLEQGGVGIKEVYVWVDLSVCCCFSFLQCERSDVQMVDQKMAQKDAQGLHEVIADLVLYYSLPNL